MFYTAYKRPITEPAPAGEKEESVYQTTIDLHGHKILKEIGKTNIYDIIQESLESSKIENIIRRASEGDINALTIMNGQYIDTTDIPNTLAEAQNFVIQAKNEFDQLPINIRRQFNMSAEQYIAEYGKTSWIEKLGITPKQQGEVKIDNKGNINTTGSNVQNEKTANGGQEK